MGSRAWRPQEILPAVGTPAVHVHVLRAGVDDRWWNRWTGESVEVRTLWQDPDDARYERPTIAPIDVAELDRIAPGMEFQSCHAEWPSDAGLAFARGLLGLQRFFTGDP